MELSTVKALFFAAPLKCFQISLSRISLTDFAEVIRDQDARAQQNELKPEFLENSIIVISIHIMGW